MKSRTPGDIAAALIIAALAMVALLDGCTPAGAPNANAQRIVAVACAQDAALQPIVVPVIVAVGSAAAPGAAPAIGAVAQGDALLLHPAVVAACAAYASKPAAVVATVPPGAAVAPAVTVAAP
jgi:uncharacterized protein YjeT (DUF2065 family)